MENLERGDPAPPGPGRRRRYLSGRARVIIATAAAVLVMAAAGTAFAIFERTGHERPTSGAAQDAASDAVPEPLAASVPAASSPSVAASPSPSASVSKSPQKRPPATGWPSPRTTGVPAGVRLKPSGSLTIRTAGTVIDGLDVSGCIVVQANNVTIKRTRVRGSCSTGTISTGDFPGNDRERPEYSGILIEDVEVDGKKMSTANPLIAYAGFTCRRCYLHGGGTAIRLGRWVTVEDSYIHDPSTGGDSHNAGISMHGSNHVTLRRNYIECVSFGFCSSALSIYPEDGNPHDILVEGNLFAGGGYCVYGGVVDDLGYKIRFLNNAFSTSPYPKCGYYGPLTFWGNHPGNEWTGNYWNDGKKTPVPPDPGPA